MAQDHLDRGHPQPSSQTSDIDPYGNSTARNPSDREQALKHNTRPSSSRHDAPLNETTHGKRQRANTDKLSIHDAPIDESGQHKRKRTNSDQPFTLRLDSRIDEQSQHSGYGPAPDKASSLRQDTRVHRAAPFGQQTQSNHQLAFSRRDERGPIQGYQDLPSSSRHHTVTDLADKGEHQASSEKASENDKRKENMEVLTAQMNKLPPPCWGDEQVMLPLVQEQLMQEDFYRRQEQQLDDIWGMYGKEREALADPHHNPEPETWTPEFEEEEILERETPLWEEIWKRSVQEGEACMRDVLGEDENWPREAPEEANIWTREPGGMLSAASLRGLLNVFTLQEQLREGELERSDESRRANSPDKE